MLNNPNPMTAHYTKSFIVHALFVCLLVSLESRQTHYIHVREQQILEDVQQQRELAAGEAREEERELAQAMLEDRLMEQLEEVFKNDLSQEDEEKLIEKLEDDLKKKLEPEQATREEPTPEELAQLEEKLRREMLDEMKEDLSELRQETILDEVRRFVRDEIAPVLAQKIEQELKNRTGEDLKKELENSARKETADLKKNARETQKEVARQAKEGLEEKVREAVEKELVKQAIPQTTDKIVNALKDELDRSKIDAGPFTEKVKNEVSETLKEALKQQPPSAQAAMVKPDEAFGGKDAKAIESAKRAVDQAIEGLRETSKRQNEGRQQAEAAKSDAARADAAKAQADLTKGIGEAVKQAQSALRSASQSTTKADGAVHDASRELERNEAGKSAKAAAESMAGGHAEKATQQMSGASEALDRASAKLDRVSKALGDAAASSQAQSTSSGVDLKVTLGEGKAREAVSNTKAAAERTAAQSVAGSVSQAVKGTDAGRGLPAEARSRLARMEGLNDKLAQIEKNVESGRDVMGEGASAASISAGAESAASRGESTPSAPKDTGSTVPSSGAGQANSSSSPTSTQGQGTGAGEGAQAGGQPPREAGNSSGVATGSLPGGKGGAFNGVISDSHGARGGVRYNAFARFNRELYKQYREMVADRSETEQSINEMEAAATAEGQASQASGSVSGGGEKAGILFIESIERLQPKSEGWERAGEREVQPPSFKYLAFGVAPFQAATLQVDGDLSDWGELTHPMHMAWRHDGSRIPDGQGVPIYVRWNAKGLYFAYRIPGRTQIEPNTHKPYEGDCLEVWLDVDNLRKQFMEQSPYTQQFSLMPFGFQNNTNATFSEIGRGFRGILKHDQRVDTETEQDRAAGISRARIFADGYAVEGFIGIKALAKPQLKSGMYVAMNFSVNQGFDYAKTSQWSFSKGSGESFNRPDTWGDVLLLGSDAEARFVDFRKPGERPDAVAPGDPLAFEVVDKDMNQDSSKRDRILAEVKVKGGTGALYVILQETGVNTGIFRGSCNTQPAALPSRANTLNARGGDTVEFIYKDARASYGEKDRQVKAEIKLGLPVFKLSQLR